MSQKLKPAHISSFTITVNADLVRAVCLFLRSRDVHDVVVNSQQRLFRYPEYILTTCALSVRSSGAVACVV